MPASSGPSDPAAQPEHLNLKQVARALGVHYMTAYRYVRQGRLPATRTGQIWLVATDDLDAFRSRLDAHPARGSVDWADRLHRRLVAGDESGAARVLDQALAAGHSPTACHLDLLAQAIGRVGTDVAEGRRDLAEERVATTLATRLTAQMGARFRHRGRTRGAVVMGGPPGEHHALAIAIVANVVRLGGYAVVELGPDAPLEAFLGAVAHSDHLLAVGVGVTTVERLPAAMAVIDGIRAAHPELPVILGGQAVRNPEVAGVARATAWAADAHEVVAAVERIAAAHRRAARLP